MNTQEQTPENKKEIIKKKVIWWLTVCLSEIIGSANLVFFGCIGGAPNIVHLPSHLGASMAAGVAVATSLQVFGHISGGFVNPTITIAAMIFKFISVPVGCVYMVCQFIGSFVGYVGLMLVVPEDALYAPTVPRNESHAFCTTVPNKKLNLAQAFAIEYMANAILVLICWAMWDPRAHTKYNFVSLKFGAAVFGLIQAFGDFTGPSLNTARTVAAAIYTGVWKDHWIYWLAPNGAAIITSFFYKYTFLQFRNPNEPEEPANN